MLDWLVTHADLLLSLASGLVAVASAIAALTPTPKDDGWAAACRRVVDLLALNIGHARRPDA